MDMIDPMAGYHCLKGRLTLNRIPRCSIGGNGGDIRKESEEIGPFDPISLITATEPSV